MQSQSKEYDKKNIGLRCLSRGNFCREFTHFFGIPFTGLKNMVAYQKLQISDMAGMISVDGVVESVGGGGSQVPRPTW